MSLHQLINKCALERTKTISRSCAFLFAVSLAIATAGAQESDRIFYHEPVEEIPLEDTRGMLGEPHELLVFQAFGREFDLRLRANKGLKRFRSKDDAVFLKGNVSGNPNAWVRLTRNGAELSGLIRDENDVYIIEPRARVLKKLIDPIASEHATNVIYRLADSEIPLNDLSCATEIVAEAGSLQANFDALMSELSQTAALAAQVATERVTIGILADHDLYDVLAPNTEAEILDRLNIVDGIFSEALGIEVSVDEVTVFTNAGMDPFDTSRVPKTLLESVRRYRTANQLDLGLTHLITGRDLAGKTAGIAYVGQAGVSGVCTDTGAAISERGSSVFISALIIAHEIGHNFGAGHDGENKSSCEAVPETYLMAPVINGNDDFSACSIGVMQALAGNASCINEIPYVDLVLSSPVGGTDIRTPLGGEFDLSFTVANVGSDTASRVAAELDIPDIFTLVGLTADGGVCSLETAQCVIDNLPAGGTSTLSARLIANAPGNFTIGLDISTPDDVDITTNSGAASIIVEVLPDLRVRITGTSSLEAGQTGPVSIRVDNNSAVIATDVGVQVAAASGLLFEILSVSDGVCSAIACTLTSLPGSASLQIELAVTGRVEGAMTITAESGANESDVMPDDNSATHSISVVTPVTAPTRTNSNGGGGGLHWIAVLLCALAAVRRRACGRSLQRRVSRRMN